MRALWLADGALRFRDDVRLGRRRAGEARVRVLKAGVCGTDLALLDGMYEFRGVPGHEFVGVVEEGPAETAGRRVVAEINVACGRCAHCRAGASKHCAERAVIGIRSRQGAFAERIDVPVANLHAVPEEVPTDAAVFVEPLAAALDVVARARPRPGQRALVLGAGRLGQLVCRVLAVEGCEVVAAGRDAGKLARLEGVAARAVSPDDVDPRAFDLAVDCTGHPAGLPLALRALKPRGTLVLKSTYPGAAPLDVGALVVDEIRVLGSRCGPFDEALRLLSERRVDVEPLIDARYPLAEGAAALRRSREPGVLKVLLEP